MILKQSLEQQTVQVQQGPYHIDFGHYSAQNKQKQSSNLERITLGPHCMFIRPG